ncbi:hypothetical protein SEPCBS119000_003767 [Sporothrix epigloea]|uniref:F-box domain-containing protein n=1 Tax=Sporothrix epigloea TaxID=1892477 RepID=A0ABP0DNF8_9PEZI
MADVLVNPSRAPGQDRLSRLPVELLLRITRHLKTAELCKVRLCSRTLERALHHYFLHEFFRCKQFMLTDLSLQALLAIAQHPDISQTLRHVSIGVEEICPVTHDPPADIGMAMYIMKAVADQKALLANGRAVQLLATAFSLLPNLETVQLRDFDSHTRYREGRRAAWSSYGLWCMREYFGSRGDIVLRKTRDENFCSRVFSLVVTALAQSKARPPNLEVLMNKSLSALNYLAFDLTPSPRLSLLGGVGGNGDGVGSGDANVYALSVLAGLRRLHLKLQCGFHPQGIADFTTSSIPYNARYTQAQVERLPLRAWLAHCPNLEWFRLNLVEQACLFNDTVLKELDLPLPYYYSFPPASMASRKIAMPFASNLRRFDLGVACCTANVLLELLGRLTALEHLSLWHFSLVFQSQRPQSVWKGFLYALAEHPLGAKLRQLSLTRLGTSTYTEDFPDMVRTHRVTFNGLKKTEYNAKVEKSMASWLQNTAIGLRSERHRVDRGYVDSAANSPTGVFTFLSDV